MKFAQKAIILVLLLILASPFVLSVVQALSMVGETKVFVYPDKMKVKVSDVFKVYINISDVSGLQGFDFMLTYNTSILDCLALEEGTFLSRVGNTFIAKQEINDKFSSEFGRVWLAIAILGQGCANGSGTLAVIKFNATAVGESVLDLYSDYPHKPDQVKLATCGLVAIPNSAIDGHVVADCSSNNPDPPDPPDDAVDPPNPDINGDGIVNIKDMVIVAMAYGTSVGVPGFNISADLNQDGSINMADLYLVARTFGGHV